MVAESAESGCVSRQTQMSNVNRQVLDSKSRPQLLGVMFFGTAAPSACLCQTLAKVLIQVGDNMKDVTIICMVVIHKRRCRQVTNKLHHFAGRCMPWRSLHHSLLGFSTARMSLNFKSGSKIQYLWSREEERVKYLCLQNCRLWVFGCG